jgi:hypothetical protein
MLTFSVAAAISRPRIVPSFFGTSGHQGTAEKCSCIFGIPAGQEPKCLGGHGWPREAAIPWRQPKNAPAFSAFPPSMAVKKTGAFAPVNMR